jgi:uncharacterized protein (DUF433 family)
MLKIANRHARVTVAPEVMDGKPCIRGTRIPVDLILRYLGGQSVEDILHAFPGLTAEDVRAAAAFPPTSSPARRWCSRKHVAARRRVLR